MQQNISSYLTGLTNLASSISSYIGPSFIEVDCMYKKDYKKSFANKYKIKEELIELEETNKTLEQILASWLGTDEKKLLESLLYWINLEIGNPIKVYTIKNNKLLDSLGRCDGGISMFYLMDDMFFVEFKKYMVCFTMGNNE
ncbi:MAG: hypothetical protein VZS44_01375 [Bacilli bacterium]|nr:hypothetical protein [Bacilli bacterium]